MGQKLDKAVQMADKTAYCAAVATMLPVIPITVISHKTFEQLNYYVAGKKQNGYEHNIGCQTSALLILTGYLGLCSMGLIKLAQKYNNVKLFNMICKNNLLAYAITGLTIGFAVGKINSNNSNKSYIEDITNALILSSFAYGITKLHSYLGMKYANDPKLAMLFKGLLYTGVLATYTLITYSALEQQASKTQSQFQKGK